MRWTVRVLTGVVSAGLAGVVGLQVAAAAGATQTRTPAPAMMNPCNGELMLTTGTVHTVTGSHPGHFVQHSNFQGVKGTGTVTGTRTVVSGTSALRFNAHKAIEETQANPLRVIGQGSGPKFLHRSSQHTVVTPRFVFRMTSHQSTTCK